MVGRLVDDAPSRSHRLVPPRAPRQCGALEIGEIVEENAIERVDAGSASAGIAASMTKMGRRGRLRNAAAMSGAVSTMRPVPSAAITMSARHERSASSSSSGAWLRGEPRGRGPRALGRAAHDQAREPGRGGTARPSARPSRSGRAAARRSGRDRHGCRARDRAPRPRSRPGRSAMPRLAPHPPRAGKGADERRPRAPGRQGPARRRRDAPPGPGPARAARRSRCCRARSPRRRDAAAPPRRRGDRARRRRRRRATPARAATSGAKAASGARIVARRARCGRRSRSARPRAAPAARSASSAPSRSPRPAAKRSRSAPATERWSVPTMTEGGPITGRIRSCARGLSQLIGHVYDRPRSTDPPGCAGQARAGERGRDRPT